MPLGDLRECPACVSKAPPGAAVVTSNVKASGGRRLATHMHWRETLTSRSMAWFRFYPCVAAHDYPLAVRYAFITTCEVRRFAA
ncbi:MAG: hypothetical protein JSU86_04350 [Phycisphaerales bacterium]|nr:MAG: hypothetical protein JSU86_04350 [Phycisphaerales bacterium]